SAAGPATTVLFERSVLPILTAHCLKCHGLEAKKAGLDLRTVELMLQGGDSGPAIVKGSAEKRLLYQRIAGRSMPPRIELPLTEASRVLIRRWLDAGAPAETTPVAVAPGETPLVSAKDRQFWAFRRPVRPALPQVRCSGRLRSPVDA